MRTRAHTHTNTQATRTCAYTHAHVPKRNQPPVYLLPRLSLTNSPTAITCPQQSQLPLNGPTSKKAEMWLVSLPGSLLGGCPVPEPQRGRQPLLASTLLLLPANSKKELHLHVLAEDGLRGHAGRAPSGPVWRRPSSWHGCQDRWKECAAFPACCVQPWASHFTSLSSACLI